MAKTTNKKANTTQTKVDFFNYLIEELDNLSKHLIMKQSEILQKSEANECALKEKIKEQEVQLCRHKEKMQEMHQNYEEKLQTADNMIEELKAQLRVETSKNNVCVSQDPNHLWTPVYPDPNTGIIYHYHSTPDEQFSTEQVDNNFPQQQWMIPLYPHTSSGIVDYSQPPQRLIPAYRDPTDLVHFGKPLEAVYPEPNTGMVYHQQPIPDGMFYPVNPDFHYPAYECPQPFLENIESDHQFNTEHQDIENNASQDQMSSEGVESDTQLPHNLSSDLMEETDQQLLLELGQSKHQDQGLSENLGQIMDQAKGSSKNWVRAKTSTKDSLKNWVKFSKFKEDKKQLDNLSSESKGNDVQEETLPEELNQTKVQTHNVEAPKKSMRRKKKKNKKKSPAFVSVWRVL
ncbi:uncharacterized protein LOC114470042 [Gouania willdenowi]|uniref:uncharacterized protein LOC114470015 n=1 Tax=Gouania willdenowi TaxID=441366 RepID=UPI0010569A3E|nr:uncharacterized protein LOC114470015 [Gouania willdenowi]XP_028313793.1 uncharacterized protein LOC114470015 [Gouania willdenowi]XP_028313795.1 uncharacterized protein LOC114470015 [Gouania willdenowi]XP_028313834.1 uncharacterized protein LOC114470042 [Gouania willdenowi]XP_028313835.1 uncharacterized protein LOC114470042 [Gouania willdenowi]